MADYLPKFPAGPAVTFTADGVVTGGRVVAVTDDGEVALAGADSGAVVGVASRDAKDGEKVAVFVGRGAVHRLIAAGSIRAGDAVTTAAAGKAAVVGESTSNKLGLALTSADADGVVEVLI